MLRYGSTVRIERYSSTLNSMILCNAAHNLSGWLGKQPILTNFFFSSRLPNFKRIINKRKGGRNHVEKRNFIAALCLFLSFAAGERTVGIFEQPSHALYRVATLRYFVNNLNVKTYHCAVWVLTVLMRLIASHKPLWTIPCQYVSVHLLVL